MRKLFAIATILTFIVSCHNMPKRPTPKHPNRGDAPTLTTPDGQKFKAGERPPSPKALKRK